jgi:threonine/homoserine/homoserine lactone efflux protein
MVWGFLLRGLLIGLAIAAPVGPIGTLCIRRTLSDGRAVGLATGLGAATADGMYGAVAGFGLTLISALLLGQQLWLRLIGGLFLCYLGARTLVTPPARDAAQVATRRGLAGAYLSTVALTIANPTTIFSFLAIFAGLGVAGAARGVSPATVALVLGVLLGSALWWLILTTMVSLLRARLGPTALRWINRLAGAILLAFGVAALVSLLVR